MQDSEFAVRVEPEELRMVGAGEGRGGRRGRGDDRRYSAHWFYPPIEDPNTFVKSIQGNKGIYG